MKKIYKWLTSLVMGIIIISSISHFNAVNIAAQDNNETYIIATDSTFAPFEFIENGEYVGIDMDILRAIAEDQDFDYELSPMSFSAALQALETEQVDGMMAGMGITAEREESFDFSESYYQAGVQFAVLEDSEIQNIEELEGMNVAVKTGTTGATAALELGEEHGFTVTQFEDSVNMYEDLIAGNSDAVVEDYPVMAYAAQEGNVPLRFIGEQTAIVEYGFAVPLDQNAELLDMFNAGLANIEESGQLEEIVASYLGERTEAATDAEEETGFQLSDIPIIALLQDNYPALLDGLWTTIWITLVAFAIALVAGVVLGLMRTSGNFLLGAISQIYIDIMRGIPLIVLSFFIYFGIPGFTGLNFNAYTAGLLTLSLNAAAYIAEIVRGGIQAVAPGQSEAARSLGLSQGKTMRHVVLPQAFKIMIPSFINQFVITLKDTSILSVIGMVELTQTGRIIIARTYQSGNMWLIIGGMYIILITILTKISNRLEGKRE